MALNPLQILVVDDNQDHANSFAAVLTLCGHQVSVAYHAKDAIALAWGTRYDVAFMDVAMPELDGYRLGVQIKQSPNCKDLVLIAVTGYADDSHQQRGAEAGFAHTLIKPVELAKLQGLLAEVRKN